jgi:hypothetical protein
LSLIFSDWDVAGSETMEYAMKNIFEVLERKEAEYQKLGKEIEALRLATRLLAEDAPARAEANPRPAMAVSFPPRPVQAATMREHADSVGGGNVSSLRQFP